MMLNLIYFHSSSTLSLARWSYFFPLEGICERDTSKIITPTYKITLISNSRKQHSSEESAWFFMAKKGCTVMRGFPVIVLEFSRTWWIHRLRSVFLEENLSGFFLCLSYVILGYVSYEQELQALMHVFWYLKKLAFLLCLAKTCPQAHVF